MFSNKTLLDMLEFELIYAAINGVSFRDEICKSWTFWSSAKAFYFSIFSFSSFSLRASPSPDTKSDLAFSAAVGLSIGSISSSLAFLVPFFDFTTFFFAGAFLTTFF